MLMKVESETMRLSFDKQANEWRMAKGMQPAQGPANYPKLEVKYGDTGEFSFVILNPKDVKFAATDPFAPKGGMPNKNDFKDQFAVTPSADGRTLTVKDANSNKAGGKYDGGDYHYELRFSDGSTLDPIITNGGCCNTLAGGGSTSTSSSSLTVASYAVGAAAILLLAVYLVRSFSRRNAATAQDRDSI